VPPPSPTPMAGPQASHQLNPALSSSNGLAFWLSEKTNRKFAELYAYNSAQQKCSPATVMVMCYGVIHWGFPVKKRQTSELYSQSQLSHMASRSLSLMSVDK